MHKSQLARRIHKSTLKSILKLTILLIIMLNILIINSTKINAAIITGSIYDLALQKESNIVIEINTLPKQVMVSKDGDYLFNVKNGNYTLYAYTTTAQAIESLIVKDDGNYTLDIILEEKSFYSNTDLTLDEKNLSISTDIPNDSNTKLNLALIIGLILIIILIMAGIFLFIYAKTTKVKAKSNIKKTIKHKTILKKPVKKIKTAVAIATNNSNIEKTVINTTDNNDLDEYETKILDIIKKEKRTTQKEIRSQIPLSEAKISLIISDLEDKGMIRKIKKGRGNILIFIQN